MNLTTTPSRNDYIRLHRALVGFLLLLLAFVLSGLVIDLTRSENLAWKAICWALYSTGLVLLLIAVQRAPLTREQDPTREKFAIGSARGRMGSLLSGVGCLTCAVVSFLAANRQFNPDLPWFVLAGVAMLFWSTKFPTVDT